MAPEVISPPLWLDLTGHLGYISLAVGVWLLAQKSIWGWLFRWIGEAIWLTLGVVMGMSSIWFWSVVFLFIEIYGFSSWRKMRKSESKAQ